MWTSFLAVLIRRIATVIVTRLEIPGLVCLVCTSTVAGETFPHSAPGRFREDRILIKPKRHANAAALAAFHREQQTELLRTLGFGQLQVLKLSKGATARAVIQKYQQSGLVEYAEPDYRVHLARTPNDPRYLDGTLWALHNTGQSGGLRGADIHAPEAWDVRTSASNLIVAVVDSGVRFTHQDLAANMWINPLDGSHGFNAFTAGSDAGDDNGHGTRIAGILGAVGNNGVGLVGVAWRVEIMACKFVDSSDGGTVSDAVACIDFARTNRAQIINASWGTYEFSLSLSNAIYDARSAHILVVAAAGNESLDNDEFPFYPASFDLDNVVSVAATTRTDELYRWSNTGATTVDLAAPGQEIYSTDYLSDDAYATDEGTSMAAAYVSGASALLRARFSSESPRQIINRLLDGVDPLPSLTDNCVSGGRLNLEKALGPPSASPAHLSASPTLNPNHFSLLLFGDSGREYILESSTNLTSWAPIFTNTTSADGTFTYDQASSWPQQFFRARSSP